MPTSDNRDTSSSGNKKAEELAKLIRETNKDRKDPNKPAHGDNVK